jgi:parvulin-like peptidyl-prolyl isomerase
MIARRRRGFALVLIAGAVALVASGCSSSLNDAATVNFPAAANETAATAHVTRTGFDDEMRQMLGVKAFRDLLVSSNLTSPTNDSINPRVSAYFLSQRVDQAAVDRVFDAHDLHITDADIAKAQGELATPTTESASPILAQVVPANVYTALPKDLQRTLAERRARADAVIAYYKTPTPDMVKDFFETNKDRLNCKRVAHVLVKTEAEANAALAQLRSGTPIAQIAAAQSIDTTSGQRGGDLGCLTPKEFVAPFQTAAENAPLNTPVGPVHTEFGYHVILVTQPKVTIDNARDQIVQALQSGAAFESALASAKVRVDPRYGTAVGAEAGTNGGPSSFVIQPPATPDPATNRQGGRASTTTTTVPLVG